MFEHRLTADRHGRELYLTWLHHEWTYAHFYEGLLSLRRNQGLIAHGRRVAARIQAAINAGALDPAPNADRITPHVLELASIDRALKAQKKVAALPPVLCAAGLDSTSTIPREEEESYSSLVVVWFQDEVPMPIADEALRAMAELDWNELASGWAP